MKIVFNDATKITIQSIEVIGDQMHIRTINNTPEQLRVLFEDEKKTQIIQVEERGQIVKTYEGYTEFIRTEEYTGKIYGIVMCKQGRSTAERLTDVEQKVEGVEKDVENLKESGGAVPENYSAVFAFAQMQAQGLSDAQAVQVKSLYDAFDDLVERKFTAKEKGFKFRDGDTLYKTAKDGVKFEAHYRPGEGTESLYTRIDEAHAGNLEDPIPAVANMEYEYGKYYIEDSVIYICKRGGIPNPEELYGQKVTLQYLPSQVIGQYFEKVTE